MTVAVQNRLSTPTPLGHLMVTEAACRIQYEMIQCYGSDLRKIGVSFGIFCVVLMSLFLVSLGYVPETTRPSMLDLVERVVVEDDLCQEDSGARVDSAPVCVSQLSADVLPCVSTQAGLSPAGAGPISEIGEIPVVESLPSTTLSGGPWVETARGLHHGGGEQPSASTPVRTEPLPVIIYQV